MKTKKPAKSTLMDSLKVCFELDIEPDTWRKRVYRGQAPLPHSRMGARSYYRRVDVRHRIKYGVWPAGMKYRDQPKDVPAPPMD